MVYQRFVQIGRVVFLPDGKYEGKLAAIVEVIDANRALLDGPGVPRHACSFKHMELTKFMLPLRHGARSATVRKSWETAKISEQWQTSAWALKLKARELRKNLTDFDRFKLMKAKQARNRIVHLEYCRLKKGGAKKAGAKKGPAAAGAPPKKAAPPKAEKAPAKKAEKQAPAK